MIANGTCDTVWIERSHGGNVHEVARAYGLRPDEIIDFSANINPSGPPARVLAKLAELSTNAQFLSRYPEAHCSTLSQVLAARLGVQKESIIVANGVTALINVILRALCPKCCLVPVPAFSEYRHALLAAGSAYVPFPLDPKSCFILNSSSLLSSLKAHQCDFCIITNPHNPSGGLIPAELLLDLCDQAERLNITVLVDEAFIDYALEASISSAVTMFSNVVVLRSVTKFYGLAGMRVGYALANPELASSLLQQVPSWPVCSLALVAAMEALSDDEYAERSLIDCQKERLQLSSALSGLGLKVFPSKANFLLVQLACGMPPAASIKARLVAEHRILLRDCSDYEGIEPGRYLRIAVRNATANAQLISALEEVLA